ncbi:cyanophycin synthetase [Pseudoxanthobacter soli DSM 19599]|uniref:Cyanophycin synthetase n=1 Tax=Pseudoxanthobacter soli DSM 19599 TaxID=1123029 RepID=A0A1M7ZA62_9HYPH|nr:cyanophycin synthetase [Pseudoxanthobacter soli]SHO61576.1 cyanophycin synthetase [Pseudoxanthobacter soli DSM 19599]
MDIVSTSAYVGPNVYAKLPLIRLTVDLRHRSTASVASYGESVLETLTKLLPGLATDKLPDGSLWLDRARTAEDCGLGELIAHVALNLQRLVGSPTAFAQAIPVPDSDDVEVLFGYESDEIGLEAGDLACDILIELVAPRESDDEAYDFDGEIARFVRFAQRRSLGPSAMELVRSAEARDIPWFRLNDASLIQVGQGKYQRRIEAALTSMTSHIAVEIASDKNVCNKILQDLGLPVPQQRLVYDADEAISAARRIGYPVVVKPLDGNHGRGVTVNVTTDEGVEAAYAIADEEGSAVVVESMILGEDHRLLVVNGELVAAARRVPGHVVGDGTRTIAELVEIVNQDPRRGVGHENVLTKLELDEQAFRLLGEKNYTVESVPPEGEVVYLRKTANISTGGTAVDVTDTIHPDNKIMAERAIKAVGLDLGAVDFLTTDITQSYRDTGGAICEINAGPGLRMHISPSEGKPRDVGGKVMEMLFPPGTQSRIPIAALTGTNGKTTCARMLAHILKMAGHVVGQTSTDAVYIDGNVTVKGDMTGPVSAKMVLRDPSVDIAVLETARGGIVRSGLGYMYCDVGAVLNVTSDHLGLGGVDTLDGLAEVKRVVAEVTRDTVVLNADNEYTLKMASYSPAKNITYVTRNPEHTLVREHIRLGKRAFVLEQGLNGDQIVIYENGTQIPLIWTHLIPATIEGKAIHNVENAMFAAAMAFALGKTLDQIRNGLRTFDNTFFQSPGRMNVFDEHGFRVILDYGHNEAAVGAMVDLVERLKPRGKRIVCVTCPGDRRNEDVTAIAAKVAGKFDTYICHRDDNVRGRAPDEIPQLMRAALIELGVPESAIQIVPEEIEAVDTALKMARRDDLVLIFCEGITRCWKKIIYFKPEGGDEADAQTGQRPVEIAFDVPEGYRIVTDERGVLLAPLA